MTSGIADGPDRDEIDRDEIRRKLRTNFEQRLEMAVDRELAVAPLAIVPNHHFAAASAECIATFRDGHMIACVSLVQAVAEGIAKFICVRRKISSKKGQEARVKLLSSEKLITTACAEAFDRISAAQRNDFHHMNPAVPTDRAVLYGLAERALRDLATIEGEVFAYGFDAGRLVPRHPQYWDFGPEGTTTVHLRGG